MATSTRKRRTSTANIDTSAPASVVMDKFGGMAAFCDLSQKHADNENPAIPTSTVWGWLLRGDVPPKRVPRVKALAQLAKPIVRLRDSDFIRA